ncbi:hypothetical protein L0936_19290 [Paracidovorax citrulli]
MATTVKEAKEALERAESDWRSELYQDMSRSEGSSAQEARREEHRSRLQDAIATAEAQLAEAYKHEMRTAYEAEYKSAWDDPANTESRSIWVAAWNAAKKN